MSEGPRATASLRSRRSPLADPAVQLAKLSAMPSFGARARGLSPKAPAVLQVNLGKLCNMTCRHCHVDAGPDRVEVMADEVVEAVIRAMDRLPIHTVDLTGGAPEMHPRFREIVDAAVARGKHVIDRCNLTILLVGRHRDLPEWLGARGVEIVASLPHDRRLNTDAQRGTGTFDRSVEALQRLNAAGYGQGDPRRVLTLVHNPAGAFLPGGQASMARDWRRGLRERHGVSFDRLIALNNMPISRFLDWLEETGNLTAYLALLVDQFNPGAVDGLMCRDTVSVGWDGRVYDCDFNQMLELPMALDRPFIDEVTAEMLTGREIVTAGHCFGCTAGAGSSCGGATV